MIIAYRCYLFDAGGRLSGLRDFCADTEAGAIVTARAISCEGTGRGFELWHGLRLLQSEGLLQTRASVSSAPSRISLSATPNLRRVPLPHQTGAQGSELLCIQLISR
jgi:hypothetical protein